MDKNTLDMIKELRKTGISMGLCAEAAKESNGNLAEAMIILEKKCCEVGRKFYKNSERPMGYFLNFSEEKGDIFINIKFGVESEFLASSEQLWQFINEIISKDNFIHFMENNNEFLEKKLLYLCGMLKENIQILSYVLITKSPTEKFLIHKKNSTANERVATGMNIAVISDELEEENRKQLLISMNAMTSKKVVNIKSEKTPIEQYMYKSTLQDMHEFISSLCVNNREIKISDLLKNITIKEIIAF